METVFAKVTLSLVVWPPDIAARRLDDRSPILWVTFIFAFVNWSD